MAVTIQQIETPPAAFPDPPMVLPHELWSTIWQRIEAYVAHRWSPRAVVWLAEGPGEWVPPLTPATVETVEVWSRAGEWEVADLLPSPLGGFMLPATGPYRFSGTVGADAEVPEVVNEAFKRLAAYMQAEVRVPGARSESITAGSISLGHTRTEAWAAKAMQNSGAGDLLRPYRRVP